MHGLMTTDLGAVLYGKEGNIAHIILNRPHVINAYNTEMRDGLYQALEAVRDDPEVKAVILRGAGERGFCAGADLTEFGTAPSQAVARKARWERDVWGTFLNLEKPIVAALHGFVLGSGIEMALCCDLRIASEDVRMGLPEVSLGIVPAAGGTQTIPRVIGISKALELLLANRWLTAKEAQDMGLVSQVVPREQLLARAQSMATELASSEPSTISLAKRAVRQGMDMPLEKALDLELRLARIAFNA